MGWIYITVTLILGAFAAAFFMPMLSLILIAVGMEIMIWNSCYTAKSWTSSSQSANHSI